MDAVRAARRVVLPRTTATTRPTVTAAAVRPPPAPLRPARAARPPASKKGGAPRPKTLTPRSSASLHPPRAPFRRDRHSRRRARTRARAAAIRPSQPPTPPPPQPPRRAASPPPTLVAARAPGEEIKPRLDVASRRELQVAAAVRRRSPPTRAASAVHFTPTVSAAPPRVPSTPRRGSGEPELAGARERAARASRDRAWRGEGDDRGRFCELAPGFSPISKPVLPPVYRVL